VSDQEIATKAEILPGVALDQATAPARRKRRSDCDVLFSAELEKRSAQVSNLESGTTMLGVSEDFSTQTREVAINNSAS